MAVEKAKVTTTAGINTIMSESPSSCKAGYRKSVTWTYQEISYDGVDPSSNVNGSNNKDLVLMQNCTFCEPVLFAAMLVAKDSKGNQILGDTAIDGAKGSVNDAAANYYITSPDALGIGVATKKVWHVNPSDPFTAPCDISDTTKCVNPFTATRPAWDIQQAKNMASGVGITPATAQQMELCPAGMVEVNIKDSQNPRAISCIAYIDPSNKDVTCNLDPAKGYDKNEDSYGVNGQQLMVGESSNKSSLTAAALRPGCAIGQILTFNHHQNPNKLSCDGVANTETTTPGGFVCRTGYREESFIKNGKVEFKCVPNNAVSQGINYNLNCGDAFSETNAGSNVKVGKCTPGTGDNTTVNLRWGGIGTGSNGNPWYHVTSNKTDLPTSQCNTHKTSFDGPDQLGNQFNLQRLTTMFLVNDCKVCL